MKEELDQIRQQFSTTTNINLDLVAKIKSLEEQQFELSRANVLTKTDSGNDSSPNPNPTNHPENGEAIEWNPAVSDSISIH